LRLAKEFQSSCFLARYVLFVALDGFFASRVFWVFWCASTMARISSLFSFFFFVVFFFLICFFFLSSFSLFLLFFFFSCSCFRCSFLFSFVSGGIQDATMMAWLPHSPEKCCVATQTRRTLTSLFGLVREEGRPLPTMSCPLDTRLDGHRIYRFGCVTCASFIT